MTKRIKTYESILIKLISNYFSAKDVMPESTFNRFKEIALEESNEGGR